MKIKNTFFTVAFLSTLMAHAQEESCTPSTPPEIDGKVSEWTGEWKKDDNKLFYYNICNDAENLYIRLKITDGITQAKIGRNGLTVWLDPNGKRKRKLGLKYPTPTGRDFTTMDKGEERPNDNRTIEQKKLDLKSELIKDTEVLELIGLADDNIISLREGLKNGIKVIIVLDDKGDFIYEAKIPFKAYRLTKSAIATLGIGFETGQFVMKQPAGNASAQTSAGRRGPTYYSPLSSIARHWLVVKLN
jgi:hypothetical protein